MAKLMEATMSANPIMSENPNVRLFSPATMHRPNGYSHLAEVHGGRPVFIAGQVAFDPTGNLIGEGDFRVQARQVFENLKAAVEAAGGRFGDIIKLNVYVVDVAQLPQFREVRDMFIDVKNPPASTAVQVVSLFRPELLIEVEALAVIA
jgi:enamine deaminase RidA (YjgF/YER057c/UK114 family)